MTDDEIQKEREQVNKLIGAKSAMEASLHRIKTLESAMREMHNRYSEIARCVADDVFAETRFPKGRWGSGDRTLEKVSVLKRGIDDLLAKHTGPKS